MIKLLLCLFLSATIAVLLLQLRQQRLELSYQSNKLHSQIEHSQAKLWNQQLQIAMYTAPNAISKTVNERELKMVPQNPLPAQTGHWIDAHGAPPEAE